MSIHIAPGFALPLEAVTETFAILAKRGSGKTYCAAVLVEEMVKANLPVAVVDPIGVWWGLRSNAAGDGPGLPVVVLGGDHADLPLEEGMGAAIADLIVEQRFPAVLDLSLLSKGASRRFMTAFAERLYHKNRDALHLVLDEADAWAPQRAAPDGARLLGAIEDLVRRGRARGIGVTLITQRPAVLNKDVLTQAEVLIALRMTGPRDVGAIDEWVRLHADEDQAKSLKDSLPSLPVGTAWVWSPGWLGILQKIEVRLRETFDSSATPKVGERRIEPTERAAVDLEALREHLSAQVEAIEGSDPVRLQKRVRELEKQLAQKPDAVAPSAVAPSAVAREIVVETKIERVEVPILAPGEVERLEAQAHDLLALAKDLGNLGGEILSKLNGFNAPHPTLHPTPHAEPKPRAGAPVNRESLPKSNAEASSISKPKQRILDALATFEALGLRDVAKSNVAIWANQSPKSSAYGNNLGALRTAGLIDYPAPGRLCLTQAGVKAAIVQIELNSVVQLHEAWCARLSGPQSNIVRALIDIYPDSYGREDLADCCMASATSSAYGNNLGALRSLGLVDYPHKGEVAATDLLFPKGLD